MNKSYMDYMDYIVKMFLLVVSFSFSFVLMFSVISKSNREICFLSLLVSRFENLDDLNMR